MLSDFILIVYNYTFSNNFTHKEFQVQTVQYFVYSSTQIISKFRNFKNPNTLLPSLSLYVHRATVIDEARNGRPNTRFSDPELRRRR